MMPNAGHGSTTAGAPRSAKVRSRLLAALMWLPLLLLFAVPPAAGEVTGDCTVFIKGEDAAGRSSTDVHDAIAVRVGDDITYRVVVPSAAQHFRLVAVIGPYEFVIDERNYTRPAAVTIITGNTTFDGLPGGAAGVYEYRGEVTRWDGQTCAGVVLVKVVPESAFTPIFLVATLVAGGGFTSLILLIVRGFQDSKEVLDVVKDYVVEAKHVKGAAAAGAGEAASDASEETAGSDAK